MFTSEIFITFFFLFFVDLEESLEETEKIMGGLIQFTTGGKIAALVQRFFEILKCVLHVGRLCRRGKP